MTQTSGMEPNGEILDKWETDCSSRQTVSLHVCSLMAAGRVKQMRGEFNPGLTKSNHIAALWRECHEERVHVTGRT